MVPRGADEAVVVAHIEACHPPCGPPNRLTKAPQQFFTDDPATGLPSSSSVAEFGFHHPVSLDRRLVPFADICLSAAPSQTRPHWGHSRGSPKFQKSVRASCPSCCQRMI